LPFSDPKLRPSMSLARNMSALVIAVVEQHIDLYILVFRC